jgi:hypothetical protein
MSHPTEDQRINQHGKEGNKAVVAAELIPSTTIIAMKDSSEDVRQI